MFSTVKRIIDWCGSFKKNLYIGFIFSFFSGWFAAMPVIWAAYTIGKLVECEGQGKTISADWIGKSIVILLFFIFLRFLRKFRPLVRNNIIIFLPFITCIPIVPEKRFV